MLIISPIEWCIGEPMPAFFYRILQYHQHILISILQQHNILLIIYRYVLSTKFVWLANARKGLVCGSGHTYIPTYHGRGGNRKGQNQGQIQSEGKGNKAKAAGRAKVPVAHSNFSKPHSLDVQDSEWGGVKVIHFVEKADKSISGEREEVISAVLSELEGVRLRLKREGLGSVQQISKTLAAAGMCIRFC